MNRFARIGETADPCGVPLLRCSRAQSGRLSGAASHRSTYNSTPAAVGDRPDRLGHEVPRHLIEELLDVEIDHPVVLPAPRPTRRDRVMGRLARPVAIGVRVKPVVRPRLQMHGHDRLRDPVGDRRHAQHSDTRAVRFGDLDRLDRGWKVRPRAHPVPDLVEVVCKIGLERPEILPVHFWRALVGLDPPPRLPDHQLGNHKRLVFGLWHVRSLPPAASAPVVRSDIPDQPAPWLHRHPSKQRLHGYYGPVRQRAPPRYSMPPVSAVGRLPLATLEAYNPGRRIDARLLTFRARAADQAHATFTPGTTWPIIGTPARLITGEQPDPPLSMPPRLR